MNAVEIINKAMKVLNLKIYYANLDTIAENWPETGDVVLCAYVEDNKIISYNPSDNQILPHELESKNNDSLMFKSYLPGCSMYYPLTDMNSGIYGA